MSKPTIFISSDTIITSVHEFSPKCSKTKAVFNIILTGVGVGMLGLPRAISQCGYIFGFVLLLLCTGVGLITNLLLYQSVLLGEEVKNRRDEEAIGVSSYSFIRRYDEFGTILKTRFNRPNWAIGIHTALHGAQVGTCALLLLLMASNFVFLFEVLDVHNPLSRTIWSIVFTLILLPLSWLRDMRSIGHLTGSVGVVSVGVLLTCIIGASIVFMINQDSILKKEDLSISYEPLPSNIWVFGNSFATLIFSFAVSGTIPTIAYDMKSDRPQVPMVLSTAFLCLATIYALISLVGYIAFGEILNTVDTVLEAFVRYVAPYSGIGKIFTIAGLIAIVTLSIAHYIVMLNPTCRFLDEVIKDHHSQSENDEIESVPSLDKITTENPKSFFSLKFKQNLIRSALVVVTALVAIFVPKFSALVDLIGSVGFSSLLLVFPVCFYFIFTYCDTERKSESNDKNLEGNTRPYSKRSFVIFMSFVLGLALIGALFGIIAAIKEF